MTMFTYVCILLLCFAVPMGCLNSTDGKDSDASLTSEYLAKMGRRSGNLMMQLIAQAFSDIETTLTQKLSNMEIKKTKGELFGNNDTFREHVCSLWECSDWSDWSGCKFENREIFGFAVKNRTCGKSGAFCSHRSGDTRVETTSKICERSPIPCPQDFEQHSALGEEFCLMFVIRKLEQDDAVANCSTYGAFLVNLNSEAKIEAVHDMMTASAYSKIEAVNYMVTASAYSSATIWVDGRRDETYSPWVYSHGAKPSVEHWAAGEPTNSYSQLCKVEENYPRQLLDRSCSYSYSFICEVEP